MSEQIEKIRQLIKTATNSKQKAMYQDLLVKLQSELGVQPESEPKTQSPDKRNHGSQENIKVQPESEPKTQSPAPAKPVLKPKQQRTALSTPETQPQPSPKQDVLRLNRATETVSTVQPLAEEVTSESVLPESQPEADGSEPNSDEPKTDAYFQGIGIIKGEVTLTEEHSTVQLGNIQYPLFYIPNRRRFAYNALKKEVETTGNTTVRLIVYPKIQHFPKKEQPHRVAFQLVGFMGSQGSASPLNSELEDGEFKFSGIWQFIPVCRIPCISVFRNFNQERLTWIKQAEAPQKVKFMKASHIPLMWRDSPVRPFRFNPKLEKEQQAQTYFVQVKARFVPERDVFEFVEQLSEPIQEVPGFLKASKKLKAEALKALSASSSGK